MTVEAEKATRAKKLVGVCCGLVLLAIASSGCRLGPAYVVRDDRCLYYKGTSKNSSNPWGTIRECDPATFERLSYSSHARDATHVWFGMTPIAGADPESFEVLATGRVWAYGRDRERVYLQDQVVLGADPATFDVRRAPLTRDDRRMYCGALPLFARSTRDVRILERSTGATTSSPLARLSERYPSEGVAPLAPFIDRYGGGTLVKIPSSFAFVVDGVVYRDCWPIPGASPVTFEILSYQYARDARAVYYRWAKVEGADVATFEAVSLRDGFRFGIDGRDAKHTYFQGRVR
jgi:hypothetical protein